MRRSTFKRKYGCARFPADCCGDSRVRLNRCWAAAHCNPTIADPADYARLFKVLIAAASFYTFDGFG
ncbi:hypothetical protein G4O51_13150 [Candidatus Bathyarchaeota archaeon A05DMB-2]|nr:hypothetical protein [Candidatus Bathyarchaeota archaeon A05DMB-2]